MVWDDEREREENSKVFEQKGDLLSFKVNIGPKLGKNA